MARSRDGLAHALEGLFSPDLGGDRLRELHDLIEPYVTGAEGERETHRTIASPEAFADSIDGPQGWPIISSIVESSSRACSQP